MEFNIDDYAQLEASRSPVYGWHLDTVRKYTCDEIDSMHTYFFKKEIFVAIALNTFKELVTEVDMLNAKLNALEVYSSLSPDKKQVLPIKERLLKFLRK